jgi:hypothetical protein
MDTSSGPSLLPDQVSTKPGEVHFLFYEKTPIPTLILFKIIGARFWFVFASETFLEFTLKSLAAWSRMGVGNTPEWDLPAWRIDYNRHRPHTALGDQTPEEFESEWQLSGTAKEDFFNPRIGRKTG